MAGHNLKRAFCWWRLLGSKRGLRSMGNISNLITFQVASSSQSFNEDRLLLFLEKLYSYKHCIDSFSNLSSSFWIIPLLLQRDGPITGKWALLSSISSICPIPHLNKQMTLLCLRIKQLYKVAVWITSEE